MSGGSQLNVIVLSPQNQAAQAGTTDPRRPSFTCLDVDCLRSFYKGVTTESKRRTNVHAIQPFRRRVDVDWIFAGAMTSTLRGSHTKEGRRL